MKRIAIVGGGAAGVFTAYRLRQALGKRCELLLFEAEDRIGGNAQSREIGGVPTEHGAQFFHRGAQANYLRLLEELDLFEPCGVQRWPAGFTIWDRAMAQRRLYLPAHVRDMRSLSLREWGRAAKFGIFIAYCWALERWGEDWTLTVDDWLAGMRLLDEGFKREIVRPFLYQFLSIPLPSLGSASAKYAITYFVRALTGDDVPGVPRTEHAWTSFETYQSRTGLASVLEHVLEAADVRPRLRAPVDAVEPAGAGGSRITVEGESIHVDHVVLATDPHTSARILRGGAAPELIDTLTALPFAKLPIRVADTPAHHMPPDRASWQPFNMLIDGNAITLTVWFRPREAFKSWGALQADASLEHYVPLPTTEFIRLRERLQERWQGKDGVWFAGRLVDLVRQPGRRLEIRRNGHGRDHPSPRPRRTTRRDQRRASLRRAARARRGRRSGGPRMKMFLQDSIPSGDVRDTVEAYRASHGTMVNAYYDLVTDFYEYGWGDSFHFAPRHRGESFPASLARHQHFLAHALGLAPGREVLDAGCGVGGPARSIARFCGARVYGLNNNAYQVARARWLTARARLQHRCRFEVGDFMQLELPRGRFDAAYAIESTAHAPDKAACFAEIHRVLTPGATFVGYEWCLTNHYDPARRRHRDIKAGIEEGNGLPDIATIPAVARALETAGFDVVEIEDRAHASDHETPWYLPLSGRGFGPRELMMKPLGRTLTHHAVGLFERLGIAPPGTQEVTGILNRAADALVAGGETGVFTPMLYFKAIRR